MLHNISSHSPGCEMKFMSSIDEVRMFDIIKCYRAHKIYAAIINMSNKTLFCNKKYSI